MLYVFYGTDTVASAKKAHALVASLRAKRPDATFVRAEAENWSPALIEEHVGGQGLFSSKYIIFLDRLTENAEAKDSLADFAEVMQESANIFIVLEGKILADLKKAFADYGDKTIVSDSVKEKREKEDFNIFALGNALGSRDRFKSWSLYRAAVDSGVAAENILGILFWQAKSMALAKKSGSKYSDEELRSLLTDLIVLYHEGHRGIGDLELFIERKLLNL